MKTLTLHQKDALRKAQCALFIAYVRKIKPNIGLFEVWTLDHSTNTKTFHATCSPRDQRYLEAGLDELLKLTGGTRYAWFSSQVSKVVRGREAHCSVSVKSFAKLKKHMSAT